MELANAEGRLMGKAVVNVINHVILWKSIWNIKKLEIQSNIRDIVWMALLQLKPTDLMTSRIFISNISKVVLGWDLQEISSG
jgi:hypothetical protein